MISSILSHVPFPEIIVTIVIAALLVLVIRKAYVKAPPDTALIISGVTKNPRVVIARASFMIPFFERVDYVSLSAIKIDVKTSETVPTKEFIDINVDSVVTVQVSQENIPVAAMNFLNEGYDYIVSTVKDILEGNLREIIGTMELTQMMSNRNEFAERVRDSAANDMRSLGLEIKTFNIQNFKDQNGVIENLGIDNTAKIRKTAQIAKAEADRDIAISKAQAEQQAREAELSAEEEVAKRENNLIIKKAELKKESDTKQAEADAAYKITEQSQRKYIEIENAQADIAKQEKEVELKAREAEVKEQTLNAEIRKMADAAMYKKQKEAEAELVVRRKEAEAIKLKAEAEAESKRAIGAAEAEAIRLKGIAEAEAMEKKADAMKKYGEAAKMQMVIDIIPELAGKIAEPLGKIDSIRIYGGGESCAGGGVADVAGNFPTVLKKTLDTVKDVTGVDIADIMKSETIEAKINRNVNINGAVPIEQASVSEPNSDKKGV